MKERLLVDYKSLISIELAPGPFGLGVRIHVYSS